MTKIYERTYYPHLKRKVKFEDKNKTLNALLVDNKNKLQDTEYIKLNLSTQCFSNFNLNSAFFLNTNLENSTFVKAKLDYSRFQNCNLENAIFKEASLRGVEIINCDIYRTQFSLFSLYNISYYCNKENTKLEDIELSNINIKIGCQHKTIKQWDYFFSNECLTTYETPRHTTEFKRIKAHYKAFKAYLEEMYSEGV